jgi:hypothetical protein
MARVSVLRRTLGVGGQGDFADPQPVRGGGAVFQDAHPGRAELDGVAVLRPHDRYVRH